MSQVDQKRAFNKLKHDLEPFRCLIVQANSVLTWEKNFYPAVVGAIVSILYLTLWAVDLSTVTLLSLAGFIVVVFDYTYPSLSRFLCNNDDWNGQKEMQFERVCGQLCQIKLSLNGWYEYFFNSKERKSTVFAVVMSAVLLGLAYIGAIINNLLLMYLITMGLAMYPGIQDKNLFKLVKELAGGVMSKDSSKKEE